MTDTIRRVAEDAYDLAARVRAGGDLQEERHGDAELDRAARDWRLVELLVGIADRVVAVAGVEGVRVPDSLRDVTDTWRRG